MGVAFGRCCTPLQCKVVKELAGHTGVVSSLAYHPTEPLLVSASTDGTVRLWGPDGTDGS